MRSWACTAIPPPRPPKQRLRLRKGHARNGQEGSVFRKSIDLYKRNCFILEAKRKLAGRQDAPTLPRHRLRFLPQSKKHLGRGQAALAAAN
ncbi:hypothetical protein RGR602_CH01126 [Rhizobium gallicum bv. gallicum R602sp]|uniref:Uncharacterized protein n=1 Tax=Rhizobium gallicum bv. gallicum R602sp TaxID=1041138 RepID=A0A0B4WY10_9HYPH|nr:hypothetical protein RGR602_CH01126 [Rhizobium gallicum bv. gallicum R602sp]